MMIIARTGDFYQALKACRFGGEAGGKPSIPDFRRTENRGVWPARSGLAARRERYRLELRAELVQACREQYPDEQGRKYKRGK